MDVGRRHETNARSGGDSGKSTPFSPPFSTRGRGLARRRNLRRSAGEIVEFQRESRDVRKGGVSPLALAGVGASTVEERPLPFRCLKDEERTC